MAVYAVTAVTAGGKRNGTVMEHVWTSFIYRKLGQIRVTRWAMNVRRGRGVFVSVCVCAYNYLAFAYQISTMHPEDNLRTWRDRVPYNEMLCNAICISMETFTFAGSLTSSGCRVIAYHVRLSAIMASYK